MTLYTWGYGNARTLRPLLDICDEYRIDAIADVRRGPGRPPWTWNIRSALEAAGLRYLVMPALSNLGESAEWPEVARHVHWLSAIQDLIWQIDRGHTLCLLCAESSPFTVTGRSRCHRIAVARVVAEEMKRRGCRIEVMHLGRSAQMGLFGVGS